MFLFDDIVMHISCRLIINDILIPSLKRLYEKDYLNIKYGVSERNICARLAHHMENIMRKYDKAHSTYLFCDYYVDVEYNRMSNGDLKTFENSESKPQYMVSDLLIHSRRPLENYLAVEMKRKGKAITRMLKKIRNVSCLWFHLICRIHPIIAFIKHW